MTIPIINDQQGLRMAKAQWFFGRTVSLPASALADPKLKIRSKLILAAIAAIAGRSGRTKPISKGEIAAACGLPATNLARELRELVAAGWLEVSRQPGSSSIYRLNEPKPQAMDAGAVSKPDVPTTQPNTPNKLRMSDTRVTTCIGTVTKMEKHNNSWLVSFTLTDESTVSTIFPGVLNPCETGDSAHLYVREWQGRKIISGGFSTGVHWINHHPPVPVDLKTVEIVVSELDHYATPAGRVYVSIVGKSDTMQAKASFPETQVPREIEVGSLVRISRRDGGLMSPDITQNVFSGLPPVSQLEIAGESFIVESIGPQGTVACKRVAGAAFASR
ncbi:MAG: helix-turn-helix domain-containing protein [Rhodocyclaceae bacterium]|nr:helix-turn-helix domain-containing protein [Rhodocyclaceae bacterium]MDZ4215199.1 helix-turn-helix domain-containing protein [Rhodocyclaceae bacterium]